MCILYYITDLHCQYCKRIKFTVSLTLAPGHLRKRRQYWSRGGAKEKVSILLFFISSASALRPTEEWLSVTQDNPKILENSSFSGCSSASFLFFLVVFCFSSSSWPKIEYSLFLFPLLQQLPHTVRRSKPVWWSKRLTQEMVSSIRVSICCQILNVSTLQIMASLLYVIRN